MATITLAASEAVRVTPTGVTNQEPDPAVPASVAVVVGPGVVVEITLVVFEPLFAT